jgi:RNA polymerase sigma factor (TIGR02999 family)
MEAHDNPDITQLILRWQNGDKSAEESLFNALYDSLHDLARRCLRTEPQGRTLGATALVHEAYIRFQNSHELNIIDRQHFLALAARVMRHILVDKARARKTRPHLEQPASEEEWGIVQSDVDAEEIIAVDSALDELFQHSERQARIVELRYFGGYSFEECASLLSISAKTAQRDWQLARIRLRIAVHGTA